LLYIVFEKVAPKIVARKKPTPKPRYVSPVTPSENPYTVGKSIGKVANMRYRLPY
jgi:hypothetical protein